MLFFWFGVKGVQYITGLKNRASGGWLRSQDWEDQWGKFRCQFADFRQTNFTVEDFAKFATPPQQPVIWREELMADTLKLLTRKEIIQRCGDLLIDVRKLSEYGLPTLSGAVKKMSLKEYLVGMRQNRSDPIKPEELDDELFFFDVAEGGLLERCSDLGIDPNPPTNSSSSASSSSSSSSSSSPTSAAVPTPSALLLLLSPSEENSENSKKSASSSSSSLWWSGPGSAMRLAIGRAGSGLGLHQSAASYSLLAYGSRRWTLFPPNSTVNESGWNPISSHFSWLVSEPRRFLAGDALECVQHAGDVLFVPEGWHKGSIGLGETIGFERIGVKATPGTQWEALTAAQELLDATHGEQKDGAILQEAENLVQKALDMAGEGHCSLCWKKLASIYAQMKRPRDEIYALRQALLQNPEDAPTWKVLARVLAVEGDIDEALVAIQTVQRLARDPGRGISLAEEIKLVAVGREGPEHHFLLEEAQLWQ